jgi:hypothetical protein
MAIVSVCYFMALICELIGKDKKPIVIAILWIAFTAAVLAAGLGAYYATYLLCRKRWAM